MKMNVTCMYICGLVLHITSVTKQNILIIRKWRKNMKYTESISKSLSKSHSLNHHLKSHLHKKSFSISFHSPTVFLYLIRTLERHSRLLFLASKKIRNRRWLYLDDHLEKLLEGSFHQNIYF